ncbi:hypothetical protein [Polyangium sp. y55x31]|uniref:hypothetical protein n=1 Tax=Polyangium sp. y55x31 TaxID=3042688 RepID=UPI002482461F|nr:hypothetical protein [Polyangium sp. y55x31]MDI1483631.1 hypothetical protein [Polyangium sp. y55x31]
MSACRRRPWRRCRRAKGWSRTTLLRVRMIVGARIANEPALIVLERWSTSEAVPGLVRIQIPHLGVELAVGRQVHRRWIVTAPRTAQGLKAAAAAWQLVLRDGGLRVRVSEPLTLGAPTGRDLDAVLRRGLVLELVGKKQRHESPARYRAQ